MRLSTTRCGILAAAALIGDFEPEGPAALGIFLADAAEARGRSRDRAPLCTRPAARRPRYARDEVLAGGGSMHSTMEIVDTRFSAFGSGVALSQSADQQNHAALSVRWTSLTELIPVDPVPQPVRLTINGMVHFDGISTILETVGA